ncbi:MAG TPA: hypothetical protein VF516_35800 [Kofleriaceae bacterium]
MNSTSARTATGLLATRLRHEHATTRRRRSSSRSISIQRCSSPAWTAGSTRDAEAIAAAAMTGFRSASASTSSVLSSTQPTIIVKTGTRRWQDTSTGDLVRTSDQTSLGKSSISASSRPAANQHAAKYSWNSWCRNDTRSPACCSTSSATISSRQPSTVQ